MANYMPETDVVPHSEVDLDMEEISTAAGSYDWTQAEFVYSNGGGGLCSSTDITTTDTTDSCYGHTTADAKGNSIKGSGAIRTLQGFATSGASKMYAEKWWNIYKNYWDDDDYADTFVLKAFDGGAWASKDDLMRAELVKKGVAYQAVWMYVLHEFEDAIKDCLNGDIYDNDATTAGDSPHAWDEGWAFYAGSIEGTDGSGSGQLLFQLAEKRCADFGTCADGITGDANVNTKALTYAELGRDKILLEGCATSPRQSAGRATAGRATTPPRSLCSGERSRSSRKSSGKTIGRSRRCWTTWRGCFGGTRSISSPRRRCSGESSQSSRSITGRIIWRSRRRWGSWRGCSATRATTRPRSRCTGGCSRYTRKGADRTIRSSQRRCATWLTCWRSRPNTPPRSRCTGGRSRSQRSIPRQT
jgi:hypothetical protein